MAMDWRDELDRLREWTSGYSLTLAWIAVFNMIGWAVTIWSCHH